MDLELNGKTAFITGGSMGIGKAVALELAREGVNVVIAARRMPQLKEAAAEIRAGGLGDLGIAVGASTMVLKAALADSRLFPRVDAGANGVATS